MLGLRIVGMLACGLLTPMLVGCGLFNSYRPVTVQVIDGDTRLPMADAKVNVYYPNMLDFTAPAPVSGVTDKNGLTTLRVADFHIIDVDAERPNYVWVDRLSIDPKSLVALPRRATGINYVLELWADPKPTIELVVPNGYRGPIKARFEDAKPGEYPAGQRTFSYKTDATGRVTIRGPRLVTSGRSYADVIARYENGEAIPDKYRRDNDTIGLRWINSNYSQTPTKIWIIGTGAEANALHERTITRISDNTVTANDEGYNRLFDE